MEEPEITPELPLRPLKSPNPFLPIALGVILVIIFTSIAGGFYYFAKLKREIASSSPVPSPSPTITPNSSDNPTLPVASTPPPLSPSPRPTSSPKLSPQPTTSPTPTPISLDLRFGNPSAIVKQTIDEGGGQGRVINRDFTSLQIGEFDEVKAAYSPKITTCFQIISNESLEGSKVGYTITEDDKILSEGTLSQYSTLQAGITYTLCQDVATALGSHTIRMTLNNARSLRETNYSNDMARIDYKNLADNIAPNFTLIGPNNEGDAGTCLFPQYIEDNITPYSDLKIEQKIDDKDWEIFASSRYCFTGIQGSTHTYRVRITDQRDNKNEQSRTFNLY